MSPTQIPWKVMEYRPLGRRSNGRPETLGEVGINC